MAKKRIHQIAKELDVASADIVFLANELGIEVKTASSGLTPEEEELVLLAFNEKNSTQEDTQPDVVETKQEVEEEDSKTEKEILKVDKSDKKPKKQISKKLKIMLKILMLKIQKKLILKK